MISERVTEKALMFIEQRRVRLIFDRSNTCAGAVILGMTEDYAVWFTPTSVVCECYAGTGDGYCSHAIAAMVASNEWHELALAPKQKRRDPGAYSDA